MRYYRIPVTALDSVQMYQDDRPELEWMDLDRLTEDLVGEGEETEAMLVGSAFHKYLELADSEGLAPEFAGMELIEVGSIRDSVRAGFPFRPDVREFKIVQDSGVEANGLPVYLSGVIDGAQGTCLVDHKFSTKAPKVDRLFDSLQWRCYLWMTGAIQLVYNCCKVRKRKGRWYVVENNQFPFAGSIGNRVKIQSAINDLVEVAGRIDLLNHFLTSGEPEWSTRQ